MSDVVIIGVGQTPVGEYWELSLRSLAAQAIQAARKEAGPILPDAMYIGNFFAPIASAQTNLGALLAENMSLTGIESYTVEAAEASGAAAFRQGYLAVASGYVNCALVVAVEKCSDAIGGNQEAAAAQSMDYDYESMYGLTTTSQAALLMQRYMYEYGVPRTALADIAMLAHANAVHNPNAMFRKAISRAVYESAGMVSDPLNMFDQAPLADGAAAVLLTRSELVPEGLPFPLVKVLVQPAWSIPWRCMTAPTFWRSMQPGFPSSTPAVRRESCPRMLICLSFVIHFRSMQHSRWKRPVLRAREGWKMARDGQLALDGKLPALTMGGAKARGLPFGAGSLYQIVEAVLQLRGQAGGSQVKDAGAPSSNRWAARLPQRSRMCLRKSRVDKKRVEKPSETYQPLLSIDH